MLFALAWLFNFLIGGLSGVFLSDVPSDVTTHGSFFSMAHFHYTIMGGLLFAFFAAIYYWVPKMTGYEINERLGEDPLLVDVRRVQLDLRAAARDRVPRHAAPRRSPTPATCRARNNWVSVSAFVLGASMLVFIANFVWSQVFARVPAGLESVGLEVDRVAAALAGPGAQLRPHPDLRARSVSVRRRPTAPAPRVVAAPARPTP